VPKRARALLAELAPAKINLTLAVLGRRADGYHLLDSLVAFASASDRLTLMPGMTLSLAVRGPTAAQAGAADDNLVLQAARAFAEKIPGLRLGRFTLDKRLPVAAGLGGGSADAAAALRLLARANGIACSDPRLLLVARGVGADVPVCVDPRPRWMSGAGERLSKPLPIPRLSAVLINPGVALPTKEVFSALGLALGKQRKGAGRRGALPRNRDRFIAWLSDRANDLEAPAIKLRPQIARVLAALSRQPGCRLARMSGSGATCFGVFESSRAAAAAARRLRSAHPRWWVWASALG
jgi:4-diphosphocytidyl-2-C-methyl-D-erythritol kinase